LSGEERVEEGSEKRLHGLNAFRGSLPPTVRIQTYHRSKEWDSSTEKRNTLSIGPFFNSARSL
jgi:hypothetical protein